MGRIAYLLRRKQDLPRKGFTLLELLVVVAVLSILMLIAVSVFITARERARQMATIADMRNLSMGIEAYQVDFGLPPSPAADFSETASLLEDYHTTRVPAKDHWSNPYGYVRSVDRYSLISFGKDGVDGLDLTHETRHQYERDIVMANGEFYSWPGFPPDRFTAQPTEKAP